jgi:hypothetical protein
VLAAWVLLSAEQALAQTPPRSTETASKPGAATPPGTSKGTEGSAGAPSPGAPQGSAVGGSSASPPQSGAQADSGRLGGYSWSEKPARARQPARRKRAVSVQQPLATYPGFRVLPNGTSELVLRISKKVAVEMRKANGRVVFALPGVQVGVRNNTNPLITTHFDTPLSRARLSQDKQGAELQLDLREAVVPAFKVMESAGGGISVLITLPRASRSYSHDRAPQPASGALMASDTDGSR